MTERYDVVVVGARCAGATLACHLARAGLAVAVVDRARFPSDTLSTHFLHNNGFGPLERLGVLEQISASGAPLVNHIDYRIEDLAGVDPHSTRPGGVESGVCVRRTVLDAAVLAAAAEAGAHVRTGTRVTSLVHTGGRVTGVAAVDDRSQDWQLDAPLVVGADGTGSTVARMVGARRYHALPNQRFLYWGYFEGVTPSTPPALVFHRFAEELTIGSPCDAGLYMAAVLPPLDRLPAFQDDLDRAFADTVARDERLADLLSGAHRLGPLRGVASYPLFFRESAGPGWVLVGDAGHFKDPAAGQGITDAFRQAERLADDIVMALGGSGPSLDEAVAGWWAWRDADALEMHWVAADAGAAGPVPAVVTEMLRELAASPSGLVPYWDLFHHRGTPSEVITAERLGAAAARLAGTALGARAQAELAAITQAAIERARLAAEPHFEADRAPRRASTVPRGAPEIVGDLR